VGAAQHLLCGARAATLFAVALARFLRAGDFVADRSKEANVKFYWRKKTRAFRIAWLLEEAGLSYERIIVDESLKDTAAFRAVSPMGKVPALEDGPARLSDSGAICIYIADQYPASRLGPPVGHADRGRFLQWVTYTNSVIEPAMLEKVAKLESKPISYGWGSFDLMLATLRGELAKSEWLLGESFSGADVLVGTGAYFLKQFRLIGDDPIIDPYIARCTSRPAWQRAQAFDSA